MTSTTPAPNSEPRDHIIFVAPAVPEADAAGNVNDVFDDHRAVELISNMYGRYVDAARDAGNKDIMASYSYAPGGPDAGLRQAIMHVKNAPPDILYETGIHEVTLPGAAVPQAAVTSCVMVYALPDEATKDELYPGDGADIRDTWEIEIFKPSGAGATGWSHSLYEPSIKVRHKQFNETGIADGNTVRSQHRMREMAMRQALAKAKFWQNNMMVAPETCTVRSYCLVKGREEVYDGRMMVLLEGEAELTRIMRRGGVGQFFERNE